MKILYISHSSVLPAYREKIKWLVRKPGVVLTLLLPHSWPEGGKRLYSLGVRSEDYKVFSEPILFEGQPGWYVFPFLSRVIRRVKPDIIHLEEEYFSLTAWHAVSLASKIGVKTCFFTSETLQESFRWPQSAALNNVLANASHAMAISQKAKNLLVRAGYPAGQITVLSHSLDPGVFKKSPQPALRRSLGLDGFTVGYLGRLVREKGVALLLEAAAKMKTKTRFLIVGDGPIKDELAGQAVRMGIADRVVFVRAVDNADVPAYLNCIDTLAVPSLTMPWWEEQFGRIIIEAQACEVPVVGSSSGSIPEVVGKAGLIFPEGDASALAARLDKLAQSAALRKKLGQMGRKNVLARYTDQKLADAFYKIYKKVLAS